MKQQIERLQDKLAALYLKADSTPFQVRAIYREITMLRIIYNQRVN